MSRMHTWGWAVFILVLTQIGCSSHELYRTNKELCVSSDPVSECQTATLQEYQDPAHPDAGYLLGFIEFDDQGQLYDRGQMRAVVDKLYEEASSEDLLINVFVHGWKHSAAPGDSNIQTFRQSLEHLSELESNISRRTGARSRKVVGIYLGWRGGSITLPLVKELTFWDRKNTAHKVGHGGVTEVLSQIELVRKTKDASVSGGRRSRTRLIVVGHSFGGALVYSALSQILMAGFVDTVGPAGQITDVKGFGDLVVLINPAFEAERYSTLSDMANERRTYFPSQLPVIAILTSEADEATKRAFPVGRWFSTLFEIHRDTTRTNGVTGQDEAIDQREANLTAVGHFAPYRTHRLSAVQGAEVVATREAAVERSVRLFFKVSQRWEDDQPGSRIDFTESVLERSSNSAGRNPYLVVQVDKELIPDHNTIDDPRIASFVRQLILVASQSSDPKERQLFRSRGLRE